MLLAAYLLLILNISCGHLMDHEKPDPITNINVVNTFGGAKITYIAEKQPDSSYVIATYQINKNKIRQSTSGLNEPIILDGFAESKDYIVSIQIVTPNGELSHPIEVKIHPLAPDYLSVRSTINLSADHGGIKISGENRNRSLLFLHILLYNDSAMQYEEKEIISSRARVFDIYSGGLTEEEQMVGICIADRFGNISDTLKNTIKPLREEKLNHKKFYTYALQNDSPIGYDWFFKYLFDGNLGEPGWHTTANNSDSLMMGTLGLGGSFIISRFVLYNRSPGIYQDQNPKKFTLWASTKIAPKEYKNWPASITDEGTVLGDWINIGNFVFPDPPSGLPPDQANNDDRVLGAEGFTFKIRPKLPGVRFIRFQTTETWGRLPYVNANEITLYGSALKSKIQ